MALLPSLLLAALTSAEAISTLLNSAASSSASRFAEAEKIVAREASQGGALQQYVIGVTTKDTKLAQDYLARSRPRIIALAEKTNNPLAWYLLSLEHNDLGYLKKAVEGNNVQALNAYGTILIQTAFDKKVATNKLEKALHAGFDCFRRATLQKDPNGYINLGTCYLRGFGCDINWKLAHACFQAAADAGHPEGMDYVSANYELGHGVEKNAALSLAWRMKARATRGDKAAEEWLRSGKK